VIAGKHSSTTRNVELLDDIYFFLHATRKNNAYFPSLIIRNK
jgi:hypothetical protein